MVFESESGYSTAAKTAIQNLILWNPGSASSIRSNNNGHEKISMIRKSGRADRGVVRLVELHDDRPLFDWGMVTYDPAVLKSLRELLRYRRVRQRHGGHAGFGHADSLRIGSLLARRSVPP